MHLLTVSAEAWGAKGAKFDFYYLFENLLVNFPFYFNNQSFPALFSILALLALCCAPNFRSKMPLAIWFLCGWGVFLFFYAGRYNYGADVRFSLISYVPLVLLSALGASHISSLNFGRTYEKVATPLIVLVILLFSLKFWPLVKSVGGEGGQARCDVEFSARMLDAIGPDALVISHVPSMWLLRGKNAIQSSIALYKEVEKREELLIQYPGGLYFHYGYWCNSSIEAQSRLCQRLLASSRTSLVDEEECGGFAIRLYHLHKFTGAD